MAAAQVPLLRMGRLAPDLIEAPLYARRHIGAAGMLGMDMLRLFRAVEIDFTNRTIVRKLPRDTVPRRSFASLPVAPALPTRFIGRSTG